MRGFKIIITSLMMCAMMIFLAPSLKAQAPSKSQIITEYNGNKYFVHTVERRQTLKDIAEIYDVSVQEIQLENKGLRNRPKAGTVIRIPYKEIAVEEKLAEEDVIDQDTLVYDPGFVPMNFDSDRLYKVALMMPLYLEQVDEEFLGEGANNKQLLARPFSYLHFYEGFMIAVDSMVNSMNMKIDLKVYDVDQDTNKVVTALNDPWLATSDIIVGPFHLKPFERVMAFANENDIMIVNPMTNREDLLVGNKNMVKVKPSYSYQMQWLEQLIKDKYVNNNVFIFAMDTSCMDYAMMIEDVVARNINEYSSVPNSHIKKVIKRRHDAWKNEEIEFDEENYLSDNIKFNVSTINQNPDDTTKLRNLVRTYNYSVDSLRKVVKIASSIRNNLFIVYGDNNIFATEMINKLNILSKDYPVSLIALPDWSKFDRLFNENLMKLNTIFFDDDFIDFNKYAVGKFICKFRDEYGTEPKDMAYHGFNIAWYFLNALINYGDDIDKGIATFRKPLLNTNYYFEKKAADDGYDNSFWNVYQYKNYEKVLLPYE